MQKHSLKKLHSMESLGLVSAARGEIRVEKLEDRLTPKVPFPHKHDFFHLLFVTSGGGWHEIDFHRSAVRPMQVYVMKPGQVHSWVLNRSTKGFVIEFTFEALEEKRAHSRGTEAKLLSLPDLLSLRKDEWRDVEQVCNAMRSEFAKRGFEFEICLRNYLSILLTHLFRRARVGADFQLERETGLDPFIALVEQNFKDEHRVEFYADRLGITPKALTMRTSRLLGRSARAIVQDRCLLEAKRLLAYSPLSVSEIGYELGFDDPNYFSRFFRNQAGASPAEFRRKVKRL